MRHSFELAAYLGGSCQTSLHLQLDVITVTEESPAEITELKLEIIHSSLDLHGEELSPAPPDSGGPEAKGLFETEAWSVDKSGTGRFSGCLHPRTGAFRIQPERPRLQVGLEVELGRITQPFRIQEGQIYSQESLQ